MTKTDTTEYQQLELSSSNDIIRHDARRSDRKYAEAAWHARQAGIARQRMGQIMSDAGDFTRGAEDWLSAAACFDLATDPQRMQDVLARVQKLRDEGKIPPERRDIHAALKEREEQLRELIEKLRQFDQEYAHIVKRMQIANETGDFLLGRTRDLPGLPKLHALLAIQAQRLHQLPLAVEHLTWAEKFAPGDPRHGELRVHLLLASGEVRQAIQIGQKLLQACPGMITLRVQLAQAIASQPTARRVDWEEATELLRPITENNAADIEGRMLALSLATILQHGLGHESEYRRLLSSFDRVSQAVTSSHERRVVSEMRRVLPDVFPQPGSERAKASEHEGYQPSAELDGSALRRFCELFNLSAA